MIGVCKVDGCNNVIKNASYKLCKEHYYEKYTGSGYIAWETMKQRCYNPNHHKSKNYLGRGITVYSGWLHDFKAFHDYMGNKPSPKHSIDRIDNNGNYEPGNVRWATYTQQARNSRHISGNSGHRGVHLTKYGTYQAAICINYKYIVLGTYKDKNDAIYAREQAEIEHGY